jgi:uncharacterized protein YbbC (DUF1343 family)
MMRPEMRSFVGQYAIPIVHGMTVAELAWMIQGEGLLPGLSRLDLRVMQLEGWQRDMRWPDTGLNWVATSPNIPSYASALVYPGIGIVGELQVNEGRGTPIPFQQLGAPWLDAAALSGTLAALRLPGVRFEAVSYTPVEIKGVAASPRFKGERIAGIRVIATDAAVVEPLEIGMHVIAGLVRAAKLRGKPLLPASPRMLHQIAGTTRFHELLRAGAGGHDIIAAWAGDVAGFQQRRARYLLYPA